jgi:lipoate---protein ligase
VPERSLWVDVVVPRDDPLWDDDVTRSFAWLGRCWRGALARCGVVGDVHAGPPVHRRSGRIICFAGLGPGEVVVDGRKVVGLSQRRTRAIARYQCVVELGSGPRPTLARAALDLLVEPADRQARADLADHLGRATAAVAVARDQLVAALLTALRDI